MRHKRMSTPDQARVFTEVGRAVYLIQTIEMDVATFYLADSMLAGRVPSRDKGRELLRGWDDQTMGRMLRQILDCPIVPLELKRFLGCGSPPNLMI